MFSIEFYVAKSQQEEPKCYFADSETLEDNELYNVDCLTVFKMCCDKYEPGVYYVSRIFVKDDVVIGEPTTTALSWDGKEANDYMWELFSTLKKVGDYFG